RSSARSATRRWSWRPRVSPPCPSPAATAWTTRSGRSSTPTGPAATERSSSSAEDAPNERMYDVTQLSALVTGATRGIGRGIADHLAREGYSLTIAARNQEVLDSAASQLRDLGAPRVEAVAADMADPEAVDAVLAGHREAYGSM